VRDARLANRSPANAFETLYLISRLDDPTLDRRE
jgi:hypothetical protein